MSFDTKLLRYCDHRVIEEDHVVDDDLVTVYLNSVIANTNNMVVRVNDIPWDRNNKSEVLFEEDVTDQVTGVTQSFAVSNVPVYNGANKRQIATKLTNATVQVTVVDEDSSAQFTGTDTLLVTQHRPLMSDYDIYAAQLTSNDVTVKVNTVVAAISSIEPVFGKINLTSAPLAGSTVTVTYNYRAHVKTLNADSGAVTIKETPAVGQLVHIYYYYLTNDGWRIVTNPTLNSNDLVFDRPKQTNHFLVQDEDDSDQFTGIEDRFYTQHKHILPPRAKLNTKPSSTMITQIIVKVNSSRVMPVSFDPDKGLIVMGFMPAKTDTVTITYNYRGDNETDMISVDYPVDVNRCRKCKRTGQVNDYDYDKLGELVIVEREQKLLQDILKFTIAINGTNVAHPWWGTSLVSFIGTAHVSEYYEPKFKSEIIDGGDKIKDLQLQQSQYQQVTDQEFFSYFDNITVEQSDYDPDFYEINATIVSQAATAINMTTSLYFNKPLLGKE